MIAINKLNILKNRIAMLSSFGGIESIRMGRRSLVGLTTLSSGFTLIELLVVIAILGILAAVVLVAINPAQRMAEANDTKAKSDLSQVVTASEACYTQQATGKYTNCKVVTSLVSGTFLKTTPATAVNPVPRVGDAEIVWYVTLNAKSASPGCANTIYDVYSSVTGQTTIQCSATTPAAP